MGNAVHVSERLDAFLKHETKRVILLRGDWGGGKTYFWSNVYLPERLKDAGSIVEPRHAYVSLFGVDSVEQVEQLILAKTEEISCNKATRKGLSLGRKAFNLIESNPKLKEYLGSIHRLGQMFIKNTLICIDDAERKAKSLTMEGVLGLVSVLREHTECRVVLVMNESSLEGEDRKYFDLYREKVIDETVTYAPSVEDNCKLIFSQSKHFDLCLKVFERLGINNIRIMQQVFWAIEHFARYFDGYEQAVIGQAIEHIVMLCCFHFDPNLGINVDNLPKDPLLAHILKEDEGDEEAKRLSKLTSRYAYEPTDFDQYIVNYLKNGEYDAGLLSNVLEAENERERHHQVVAKFASMWESYNSNFTLDGEAVANIAAEFLDNHVATLSEKEFGQVIQMLVDLGANDLLEEHGDAWRDEFVANRIDRSGGEHLDKLASLTSNAELLKRIEDRRNTVANSFSITATIMQIVYESGWNRGMVENLSSSSVNDIRDAILACDEDHFLSALNQFCTSWRGVAGGEQVAEQKVEEALMQIAELSRINRMRVEMIIPWAFEKDVVQSNQAKKEST